MTRALLEVRNLAIDARDAGGARVPLLRGVDIDIARGEILAVVGESGCGKSLTAKAILGLTGHQGLVRTAGTIVFEGRDTDAPPGSPADRARAGKLALVPQHPLSSLNPAFTVAEQLSDLVLFRGLRAVGPLSWLAARLDRGRTRAVRARIADALREVNLPEPDRVMRLYPHQLSGGMSQRVLIAMALLGEPALLIADEPSTALDVTIGDQINRLLVERVRAHQTAMIYITHDLGIARAISDRVSVMYAGRVVEFGPTAEILARPHHPYTRGLIDAVPRLVRKPLATIRGTLPDPRVIGNGCAFRWRCPRAAPACRTTDPGPHTVAPGHAVACLNPGVQ